MRSLTVLLVLLFSPLPALFAAAEQYEGMLVSVIAFEPREQPIPPSEMAEILPLKMNTPLDMRTVRAAVERLYATGRYSDIAVDAEAQDGKVIVRFLTKGNWFIGQVSVTGVSAPPSASQLANDAALNLGEPFRKETTETAVANMQKTLQRNGFFEAHIHPVFEHDPRTQQIYIRFEVDPGKRDDIGIPIIQGTPLLPEHKIIGATKWHWWFGWRPATATRIQRGLERIHNLYQKRDRLMAQVSLDSLEHNPETGSAVPTLSLNAGPKVEVKATGAKLSRGQLKRLVPVFSESSVDSDLLFEGAQAITEHFQTKGYFDTQVKLDQKTTANGNHSIVYEIDRGKKQKLTHLEIHGNRYFDLMTIRERMLIIPASFQFRKGRFNEMLLNRDISAITDLYRTNGFRNVAVKSRIEQNYSGKEGDIAVFIEIEEGDQWLVSSLTIEGMKADDEAALRPTLQSSPGQAFSEMNVAADRDNILAYYYNSGYLNATFEWSYQPSKEPNRADVRFIVTEGPRHYVREVLITGLSATRPQLVNRRILLNPGEPISHARILETQRRLYDLGIFAKVDTALQNPDGDEPYKYVLFRLDEAKKYSVSTGFGAEFARIGGSQTSLASPEGAANFSPRVSFDISRLNFLGRAHTVSFRSRLSTIQRRALITYVAPQFQGMENLELSFTTLFDESENIRTYSSRKWEGSVQLAHRWTRSKTMFYRFTYRRVSIDEGTLKIRSDLIPLLSQPVRVGIPSATYVDDRRDNPTDSRKGTYNSVDLSVASKVFGSQADFLRILSRNSTYHPLSKKLVLARSTLFGYQQNLTTDPDLPADEQIPLPERFWAGGASTHRGFAENQAGPRDLVTGFPLGGSALLMFSTEMRFPLFGNSVGGVLFHDAGNVYSRIEKMSFRVHQHDDTDFDYMVHAAGLGVRIRTPIGPFRVDIAYSPNTPRFVGCKGTREELLYGACEAVPQRLSRFQFHFSLGQTF